jgi:hypothetical protein
MERTSGSALRLGLYLIGYISVIVLMNYPPFSF